MKSIFAYESSQELETIKPLVEELLAQSEAYKAYLVQNFQLIDPAQAVIWTRAEQAMTIFAQQPIPAYNNGIRIIMTPDIVEWRTFFEEMLSLYPDAPDAVRNYYQNLPEHHIQQVFFHELTHDCDIFESDYESSRDDLWFEEGMCEYLSRRYLLSDEVFEQIRQIETQQVAYFEQYFGKFHVENFNQETYASQNLAYLMTFYANAFLVICQLVEQYESLEKVFERYHAWWQEEAELSLYDWLKRT
ncbi:hypothetical protein [Streptococcus merionis]|uniref:hypothetical protein n=1 Tax=Streptococcus merionis TaxID=400065 RepID=UPI0035176BCB